MRPAPTAIVPLIPVCARAISAAAPAGPAGIPGKRDARRLALDRLGQDGADVLVHDVLDGLEVVELSIAEAGGQGLEVAVHRILAGGRAGREGAAVEGVLHRDDDEALGMAVILGVLAGELDLAFVGLSAGVGEQHLVEAAVLDDELRGLDGGLIVEVVGAVQDRLGALLEALDDRGMQWPRPLTRYRR